MPSPLIGIDPDLIFPNDTPISILLKRKLPVSFPGQYTYLTKLRDE
jgi:hypothetical protein